MDFTHMRLLPAIARTPIRRLASFAALGLILTVVGCGGSSSSSSTPGSTHSSGAPASESSSGGIPQNNEGDHDSDNNGGPSDGDGNL
jgi:hypothetical protein